MLSAQVETKSRLLAKLLRELLRSESYSSLADLADALKRRCGRLRIRWTPTDISNAFQLVGSNAQLLAPETSPPPEVRTDRVVVSPLTRHEESHLYREIIERYAADRPVLKASEITPEVDAERVQRISALPEALALNYFWQCRVGENRLELLLLFEAVTIARPDDHDARAIRAEFDARTRRGTWQPDYGSGCFGCLRADDLSLHHVITVQHGGSNSLRNLVPLCVECHRYLHPWLTTEGAPRRVRGFSTLGQIAAGRETS